jgi:hypothetical protein
MATFINAPKSPSNGSIILETSVYPEEDFLLTEAGFELILDQSSSIYTNDTKH